MKKFQIFFVVLLCFLVCACKQKPLTTHTLIQQAAFYEIDSHLVAGNPKGRFTLVEFFDYRCHACADGYPAIQKLIAIDPQVRIIYRELPFLGTVSTFAARAALAAAFQGKYVKLHDALMAIGPGLDEPAVLYLAKKQGLNIQELQKDMYSNFVNAQLLENKSLAVKLAIQGTPVYLFAQTTWQKGKIVIGRANLLEGAQTLTALRDSLVDLNV